MGPRAVFVERFTLLYAEAGDPPLKRVTESVSRARRVDERGQPVRVPEQRVSDWRRGRNVPARFAVLAAVLHVLIGQARRTRPFPAVEGLYDLDAWRVLWEEALASPVATAESEPAGTDEAGVCPYRGLAAFRRQDSDWFFGRERSTAALVSRLHAGGIVMLVGASGAGKSSLLRAGLMTALDSPVVIITPGCDPMNELTCRIPDAVLVVDQFEELFTLCPDEDERRAFVRALHETPGPVVIGVRADFYGRCLDYPELAEALQERQLVLGPMTTAELREAVALPAKAVGLQLEPGLVELMLRDVGVRGAHEAGVLPLLSHALLATWQRRQAGRLTIAGYRAAGGLQGAVAATAEQAWADLDPTAQATARLILLRLVRIGEDGQDARRRSTRQDIVEQSENQAAAEDALEVLTKARLVTQDAGSVEITHEALLQAWPRLRNWIDQDRAGNLLRQRLEEDSTIWDREQRDSSLLYRGGRLEAAQNWAATAVLTSVARDFLAASAGHWRRTERARRAAVAAIVVFALIAATAAALAIQQRSTAIQQRDDAVFRQVVSEADRLQESDPSLSAQLDLVAHRMRPTDQDVNTRLLATENAPLATPLAGHTGAIYLTSFSPDGHTLATASEDKTVRLWDVHDPNHLVQLGNPLTGHTSWISSAVFNPDGHTLATAGDDGTVEMWNVTDLAHPTRLGSPLTTGSGSIYLIAFSPDGHTLATANENHTVRLWNVTDPAHPAPLGQPLTGHTGPVRSVAFSPDGHVVAAGSDDSTVLLWNVTDPANPVQLGQPLVGHTSIVHSVAFSPDGRTLATGSQDKTVRLWNVTDPTHATLLGLPLNGHAGSVWSVEFAPGSQVLATASADGTTRLWNVSDPANVVQLGQSLTGAGGGQYAVGFSPDGRTLATGGGDGRVRLWSLPTAVLIGQHAAVNSTAFSSDGRMIATGASDDTVGLWNTTDPMHPAPLSHIPAPTGYLKSCGACRNHVQFSPNGRVLATSSYDKIVQLWDVTAQGSPALSTLPLGTRYSASLSFSPDKRIVATGNDDNTVRLWDVSAPSHPVQLGSPLAGHTGYVNFSAFSPDGQLLATASGDNSIRLWDVSDPANAKSLSRLTGHTNAVNSIAFSHDGRILASVSDDQTVRLWDVHDPAHPTPLGNPLTGHTQAVTAVAFSPDGHTLATASGDHTIRLWNVTDPVSAAPLGQPMTALGGTGYALAFSPDGRFLAWADGANTVRLLDLDVEHAVQRICATTRNVLTPREWAQHLPALPYQPPCG